MAKSSTPFALPPGFTIRPATSTDRWGILKLYFASFEKNSLLRSLVKGLKISFTSFFYVFIILFGFLTSNIVIGNQIQNFAQQWLWKHNGYFIPYNPQNNFVMMWRDNAYLISFVLTTSAILVAIYILVGQSLPGVWVVECDRHIVAVGGLSRSHQYSQITSVYVAPRYRQRRLGSCLVQKLIQEANKPVFLFCLPELVGFYDRFGFIQTSKENVPPQLKFLLNDRFTFIALFIPDPAVSRSPVPANEVDILPNLPNRSYLIRQAQFRDAKKIQQVIFNSTNLDVLLPFGISLRTIYSLIGLTIQLFLFVLILAGLSSIAIEINYSDGGGIPSEMKKYEAYRWIGETISKFAISYAGLLFLLMLIALISGFWVSRQYSNFWIAERNSKIVGYARLSSCDRYSILHYLHIDKEHLTESLDRELIDRLSRTVRKPIYLACPSEFLPKYKRLGFIPVSTNSLPQKLRFGGILNQQFGGSNLVLC